MPKGHTTTRHERAKAEKAKDRERAARRANNIVQNNLTDAEKKRRRDLEADLLEARRAS